MPSSMKPPKPSIGTALSLATAMSATTTSADPAIVCQGWVLKKRRKKMQGFARRYFTLYNSGLLAYSFEPGAPVRDQIFLHHAAISTAQGRKDIHVDSSTATFHIKCLSTADFNTWMTAFRRFISLGVEARKSANIRHVSRQGSITLNRSGAIVEEMGVTLAELEESIIELSQDLSSKKNASLGKKLEKEKFRDHSKFALFKRTSHYPAQDGGTDMHPDTSSSLEITPSLLQRVNEALETIKAQHSALNKSVHALTLLANADPISARSSPLPYTAEEEEQLDTSRGFDSRLASPLTRHSNRTSISTTVSDSIHEWFDALDDSNVGPEEFFVDIQDTPEAEEQPSRITTGDSRSSLDTDTDVEDDSPVKGLPLEIQTSQQVVRRTRLPAPSPVDELSLFSILKKNVGKDLSTITFPVTFNEPLTLLQRAAEEVEYYSLLDEAAHSDDPVERMCYVAAFAISGYAHTRHRSGRKGFNPMLAETFEDERMKFIAEKVRHNPVEMAYHANGENWELSATSCGKTKFWGKSLEIIPLGTNRLMIGSDQYVWKKPSSFMRNLMVGPKYFEHCGKMIIENVTTQLRCILDLKQNGYWGPSNVVSGAVQSADGEVLSHMEGKWDEQLSQVIDSSHLRVLWRMNPFPKTAHDYYGFTSFGITLNEMTTPHHDSLPSTDSRRRPDVRALENGDIDAAEQHKNRLEELQRERRKIGQERQPRWFKQVGDSWEYIGGYWEMRARGWKGETIEPLW
ncbi:Oxysterol-binding protein-domain-containing protein [Crucibulum laeve]|uniref:Oxysterol-binding protein-domain-containing protein n=1 Tax=Crucibulum laeve TaxID=68775 RepID=A0A5C3MAZ4_9AGAR|nr:Oxysterol-binding protein-domain-containing protein [Crucibulum laeve]